MGPVEVDLAARDQLDPQAGVRGGDGQVAHAPAELVRPDLGVIGTQVRRRRKRGDPLLDRGGEQRERAGHVRGTVVDARQRMRMKVDHGRYLHTCMSGIAPRRRPASPARV